MTILTNNAIDPLKWQQLVDESTNSSFFQTKSCYDFYSSLSFLKPFVFGVEEDGQLAALVCGYIIANGGRIKRYFSRRAIIPGGLLIRSGADTTVVEKILTALNTFLHRKCIYTEFRNYSDYQTYRGSFEAMGYHYEPHLNIRLDCTDRQQVWEGLSASKRRQIRQSLEAGLSIGKAESAGEIAAFYQLLSELYNEKIHRPLFPEAFFQASMDREDIVVLLCKYRGEVCGGIVCVLHNKISVSEWFVCGSTGMEAKGIYPSLMATWAGIDYALENGYSLFDFMGAGKPHKPYGVRDFKMRFGGSLVEFGRFRCVQYPVVYGLGKFYINSGK